MATWRRFFLKLCNVLRPGRSEPALAREIDAHLTLLEDDYQRRGKTPDEARLAAKRAFGSHLPDNFHHTGLGSKSSVTAANNNIFIISDVNVIQNHFHLAADFFCHFNIKVTEVNFVAYFKKS